VSLYSRLLGSRRGNAMPFQPPPDWVWGNTQQTGDHLLMEFVKKGENIDAWTELLTLAAVPTDATIIAP
jgi:hypothetical protein